MGWALDPHGPCTAVLVLLDSGVATAATIGVERPDVAASHPDVGHAGRAGWQAVVDLRASTGPEARLTALARTARGEWHEVARACVPLEDVAGRRAVAVFTIAQNERLFLPLWLRHYRHDFDADDIYVLDHGSTDGSTEHLAGACHRVPVHRAKSFDHAWLNSTVRAFQAFLLSSYEAVLFAEVDELVVADPRRYEGLAAYARALEAPAACCTGFNVVHYPDEPPLRFDEPPLAQRRYWHRSEAYSKRLLARVPLTWGIGFHTETSVPEALPDPDLLLLHLHRADYETFLARHRSTALRDWNEADVDARRGFQNRLVDDELRRWFYDAPEIAGTERELIPPHVRRVP